MKLPIFPNIRHRQNNLPGVASMAILILLSMPVIFHLLILARIIPFEFVWGGKLKDTSQMFLFEIVSVIVILMMMAAVAIIAGIIKTKIPPVIIRIALWAMALLFFLNTIGNLYSENRFEKIFFTPLTIVLSVLSLTLIFSKKNKYYTARE